MVFALDLLGDRWTMLVVRDMAIFGRTTYGEFLESGEAIATNVLADRLKRLVAAGIVSKERDPGHGARYRYRLTEKGLDLIPILVALVRWSVKHDPDCPVPAEMAERLEREPDLVVAELRRRASQV